MVEIAQKWMERMGVKNTQYIIARHHDTKHPHCHLVYNIVDNEGQRISDSNERRRSAKICRALTEEYGLYIAPKHSKARNKDRLRAHQLQRYNLRMATLDALALAHSWNEFKAILHRSGVDLRFNQAKEGGAIRGISFGMDDVHIAGSRLDADLSFPKLCNALGTIVEEVTLQPHQAFTPCGGGDNNDRGWRDDDEKKAQRRPEPFYKPSKSRR